MSNVSHLFYRRAVTLSCLGILVCTLYSVLLQLNRDLWQDELLLAELTRPDLADILGSTQQIANHSPLFLLYVKAMRSLLGDGALQLRLTSLIPSLFAALFCWFIAKNILRLDRGESLFCVAAFCLLPVSDFGMINFRPYGPALLGITASLYYCLRFRESASTIHLLLSAGSLAMAIYCQYIYGLLSLSVLFILGSKPYLPRWRSSIGIFLLSLLVFVGPVLPHLLQVAGRSQSLAFASGPLLSDLVRYISTSPLVFLVLLGLQGVVGAAEGGGARQIAIRTAIFTFLVPLVIFYLLNLSTSLSVWFGRYIFWAEVPAIFLLGVMLAKQHGARKLAGALFILIVLASSRPPPETSGWREVSIALADELKQAPGAIVVAQTGFIEANNSSFLRDQKWSNYFLSPLRYYGFWGDALILPFDTRQPERLVYVADLTAQLAESETSEVILVSNPGSDEPTSTNQFLEDSMLSGFEVVRAHHITWMMRVYYLRRR